MINTELIIDEDEERSLQKKLLNEWEEFFKKKEEENRRFNEYMTMLQDLAGEDAIIQYRLFKGTDREEWITWNRPQWPQSQARQDNIFKVECNKEAKTVHQAEQTHFNFG